MKTQIFMKIQTFNLTILEENQIISWKNVFTSIETSIKVNVGSASKEQTEKGPPPPKSCPSH